ncbi:SDR family oxidoreductase [Aquamicrobium segne]|uniref:SDR family oxidoreductase n=1 Tax=Aquamicrobium segne TaxID=469547 RepID=A0ABW0H0L2_9HYPH
MKTVLVTGATSGIGRAIALVLAKAGHEVYALGRSRAALSELSSMQAGIVPIAADVTDREALEAALSGLAIDVLVNNAGLMPPLGDFADMNIADIDATLEVNLGAAIVLARLVAPQMRERGSGHIFFTGSTAGHAPSASFSVYSAAKAGIAGFAAALRAEMSPHGVRVTEIVPGRVETALYKDILDAEARKMMYSVTAVVQPDDIAQMVLTVLNLPDRANVSRFDIVPTRPTSPSGGK